MRNASGIHLSTLAWQRAFVRALVPLLILVGAEKAVAQNGDIYTLKIPKFFTDHISNGLIARTGDEYWLANRFVDERIITAIETVNDDEYFTGGSNMGAFWTPYHDSKAYRADMIAILLTILNNPSTHERAKCCLASYLGLLRVPEAAASLAANITNTLPPDLHWGFHEPPCGSLEPVGDALIAIGSPAIPALIRNLAESDDPKVRELSLKVLTRIENDRDIVQLRLQKALAAQSNPANQSRIRSALAVLLSNPSEDKPAHEFNDHKSTK